MKNYFRNPRTLLKVSSILALSFAVFFVFVSFRSVQRKENEKTRDYINSILMRESSNTDTYELGKNLNDLDIVGLIECVTIQKGDANKALLYQNFSSGRCSGHLTNQDTHTLQGLNGQTYLVSYSIPPQKFLFLSEILVYTGILVGFFVGFKAVQKHLRQVDLKIKAMQVEKNLLTQSAKQAKHDIASPLTAIQTIIGSVTSLDPVVKEILLEAANRTKHIFEDMQLCGEPFATQIYPLISRVLKEKFVELDEKVHFQINLKNLDQNQLAMLNENHFARIFSNIINNSWEAFSFASRLNEARCSIAIEAFGDSHFVKILIKDNGPGFNSTYLSRFGQRGLSMGKTAAQGEGSGLGLFHAKLNVESWGGKITAYNDLHGATVEINLLDPKLI